MGCLAVFDSASGAFGLDGTASASVLVAGERLASRETENGCLRRPPGSARLLMSRLAMGPTRCSFEIQGAL
jgi:hypothetical protein